MTGLGTILGKRADLPTYVGGWLASLSWLSVVGWTVGDLPFNLLIFGLTTVGFAVSFWLRGFVDGPHWPALRASVLGPSTFLRVLFMVGGVLPGLFGRQPFAALVPDVAVGTPEWLIGTGFMWAMALYSFGLVSDGLVAFSAVMGVSMLGLMASNNINPEVGIAFLAFLLGLVLMLSNMTLAHHTHRRKDGRSGRALSRWFGDQLIVAGLTVATTAFLAIGLAAVLQRYSGPGLLPRINMPIGGGGAASMTSNYAAFDEQMVVGVGGGPTSQDPVLIARVAEPQLWRRRTYDRFTGRVWSPLGEDQTLETVDQSGHAVIEINLDKARELRAVQEV
ncbi:MAG: hypothetical protein HUU35_11405, partial [Armatimonadetes bacterium]|nr:hypothetical protein [Armatimonadota bacterium]